MKLKLFTFYENNLTTNTGFTIEQVNHWNVYV